MVLERVVGVDRSGRLEFEERYTVDCDDSPLGGDGIKVATTLFAMNAAAKSSLGSGVKALRVAGRSVFTHQRGERIAFAVFRGNCAQGQEEGERIAKVACEERGIVKQNERNLTSRWACSVSNAPAKTSKHGFHCSACWKGSSIHPQELEFLPSTVPLETKLALSRAVASLDPNSPLRVAGSLCHVLPFCGRLLLVPSTSQSDAAEWLAKHTFACREAFSGSASVPPPRQQPEPLASVAVRPAQPVS